jgi:hypothetical protein
VHSVVRTFILKHFYYLPDFEYMAVKSHFCIGFRYDMDDVDKEMMEMFCEFAGFLKNPHSTLFFLKTQLGILKNYFRHLPSSDSMEIQLHSTARPEVFGIFSPRYLAGRYRHKLTRQRKKFEKSGFKIGGHSAHGTANYLYWDYHTNFQIICFATLKAGFTWLSDWFGIVQTARGYSFPEPSPPYVIKGSKANLLVLPTSWDDRFLQFVPERERLSKTLKRKSFNDIRNDVLKQLEFCSAHNIPFIINLHPYNIFKRNVRLQENAPTLLTELVKWLVAFARDNSIAIRSLSQIATQILSTINYDQSTETR